LNNAAPNTSPAAGNNLLLANVIVGLNAVASNMLGIGGGAIMVPLLIFLMKVPIKRSVGTSLAVIVMVISVGLLAQVILHPDDIHWDIAAVLIVGSFVGSFIGKWMNKVMPENVLRYAFAVVLVIVAIRMFGLMTTEPLMASELDVHNWRSLVFLAVTGVLAGVASSLFGLGGGIVVVPALALGSAYFAGNILDARATSMAMVLPTSLVGAILHNRAGNVDRAMVIKTTPLALVGAIAGVLLAYVAPTESLKILFGCLMVFAAARLFFAGNKRAGNAESNSAKK
jgi:uncharacterized membrane protein YfcA